MSNLFICNDCSERFPNPDIDMNCIKCGNKFTFFDGKWIDSPTFMWMKEPLESENIGEEITNQEIMNTISNSNQMA